MVSPEELVTIGSRCERSLQSHALRTADSYMREIPPGVQRDLYGEGGVVKELEGEVAGLLGKQAAVFMPTGTMAQQIALRVHADRLGRRTVVWHPYSHLANNEGDDHQLLHGLHGKAVGEPSRLLTLNDLKEGANEVAEPPAVLLLELPQRDLGGQLPPGTT